ncbi:YihY/virulence factor BrkB family protein [Candidatus Gracilibacteria bacterium]|nr:YihY/virulence factor BrkB family protein [Candidatus Gracilibacteria bacterium]
MQLKDAFPLLKQTFAEWNADKAPRLGAALAYYTVFSLAPLLVLAVAIAGFFFGQDAAQQEVLSQARGLLGEEGAGAVEQMIENANQPSSGVLATIIGIVTLLFGASGAFGELQGALNTIWGVEQKSDRGIKGILKDRSLAFTLVLGTGFLLLVSLVLSAVLSAVGTYFEALLPFSAIIWQIINFIVSLAVTTLLFAAIYKFIPDVKITWHDVWIGAFVTAVLFSIGRFLLGWYLSVGASTSVYGAAASFVVLLLWVYYSAQILFFGAEFTQVYANTYGSHIVPDRDAQIIPGTGKRVETSAAGNNDGELDTIDPEPDATAGKRAPGPLAGVVSLVVGMIIGARARLRRR